MFFLLGICILLAVMLALNSIASFVASLLWKVLEPRARTWSAASQASVLCLLRTLPVVENRHGCACCSHQLSHA